jgi:hypothetical protein
VPTPSAHKQVRLDPTYRMDEHTEPNFAGFSKIMDRFPLELLVLILDCFDNQSGEDRAALKLCRLTNKLFCYVATPRLFRCLNVSEDIDSLNRALNVASSANLAACINCIIWHTAPVEYSRDVYHSESVRQGYPLKRRPLRSTNPATQQRLIWSEPRFASSLGRFLCSIVGGLPNLTRLEVGGPYQDYLASFDVEAMEKWAASGIHSGSWPEVDVHFVLKTCLKEAARAGHPLQEISLAPAQFLFWYCCEDAELQAHLKRLRKFHGPSAADFGRVSHLTGVADFRKFVTRTLKTMDGLSSLRLGVGSEENRWKYEEWERYMPSDMLRGQIFELRWSMLRSLDISGLVAHENDLVEFLGAHAKTLRILRMGEIRLSGRVYEKYSDTSYRRDSIIALFHRLRESCDLAEVTLWGRFTNERDEMWVASAGTAWLRMDSRTRRECLRARIARYICHQGDSPFPGLERAPGLRPRMTEPWLASRLPVGQIPGALGASLAQGMIEEETEVAEMVEDESWRWIQPFRGLH